MARREAIVGSLIKQVLSLVICGVLASTPASLAARAQQSPESSSGYSGQGVPLTAEELQGLVAPIALYPDALVAQILGAATYPDQVAVADYWLQQNKNLTGNDLMQTVNKQTWDPSVKALTQFPSVLDNMAKNLSWVSTLGEAYHNQTSDVMSAVQTLRAQAKAAGNLKSGSQITVLQQSPQTIVIQPANPQVVYVPQYNPAVIYGTPYVTPGYSAAGVVATGILSFGAGMAVGALMSGGGCCGWGWNSWGCNWHGGTVIYNQNNFYGNRAWHGGYYGGYGYRGGNYGAGYNPRTGTYARGASGNTLYGNQRVGQAYNPRTGGRAAASSSAYGNSFAARTANGTEYAAHNGNAFKNTGSGWEKAGAGSSETARGWGQRESGGGSSAFSGSGGWGSRSASARGWESRGGGGGWGGGRGGGGGWGGGRGGGRR